MADIVGICQDRVGIKRLPSVWIIPRSLVICNFLSTACNMKGGFRHDPYQSGRLGTPAHKRAFLGAHAMAAIIYVDELKTMIRAGYMPELLELMQCKPALTYWRRAGIQVAVRRIDRKTPSVPTTSLSHAATTTRWSTFTGRRWRFSQPHRRQRGSDRR